MSSRWKFRPPRPASSAPFPWRLAQLRESRVGWQRCGQATKAATRKDSVRCADFGDELSPQMLREDVPPVPAACGPPAPRLPPIARAYHPERPAGSLRKLVSGLPPRASCGGCWCAAGSDDLRLPGRRGARAAHARARRAASSNWVRSSGSSFRILSSRAIVGLRSPSTSGRATDALTGVTRLSQSEER